MGFTLVALSSPWVLWPGSPRGAVCGGGSGITALGVQRDRRGQLVFIQPSDRGM